MSEAKKMEIYFDRLWPIMRSITGEGARQTHDIIGELVDLNRTEVPTNTNVFDWKIPKEWVFRKAHVTGPDGTRIIDAAVNNLSLMNYSEPYHGEVSLHELDKHLYSRPSLPDAIPYVTSYYKQRWGFCLPHTLREKLPKGKYNIVVDTDLIDGSLTYSDVVLSGSSPREVMLATYTCHPSMANNELSGPLVNAFLYQRIKAWPQHRLSFRFVFNPETIGALAYLAENGAHLMTNLDAGFVVTCVGDPGEFTYKRSRRNNTLGDRAMALALRNYPKSNSLDFFPNGSDERQYCSPGFNLPVGVVSRTWPEKSEFYHSSYDNKEYISFDRLVETVDLLENTCRILDLNDTYRSLYPYGEPQLSKRNMMTTVGGAEGESHRNRSLKWFLNLADGEQDLISIAERSGESFQDLADVAKLCIENRLVEQHSPKENQ